MHIVIFPPASPEIGAAVHCAVNVAESSTVNSCESCPGGPGEALDQMQTGARRGAADAELVREVRGVVRCPSRPRDRPYKDECSCQGAAPCCRGDHAIRESSLRMTTYPGPCWMLVP